MKIKINSMPAETAAMDIKALAEELSLPSAGVAVALGGAIIPRDRWSDTALEEGAEIVIIKAACGG